MTSERGSGMVVGGGGNRCVALAVHAKQSEGQVRVNEES